MRPHHDPLPGNKRPARVSVALARAAARALRPRRGPEGEAGETCPVRPDRPLDRSGGAAAALPFDA